jgi:putative DNA primase/helicase
MLTMEMRAIVRLLGGELAGRNSIRAPGPGHSAHDRSLAVRLDPHAPDGYVIHSFAGDDWRACREHVRERLGLEPRVKGSHRRHGVDRHADRRRDHDDDRHGTGDRAQRIGAALDIWRNADELRGTPAWTYLDRRGVELAALPDRIGDALRWHGSCPWGRERHPCIVALWTDTFSGAPRAVHRRPLTRSGDAIAHWRAFGPSAGCVIRLWPDDLVTHGLTIGEGIETVLAAATSIAHRGTLLAPAWGAGDASHVAALPVLAGIEALTILVDHDVSGERAAAECVRRWTAAGLEVTRLTPRALGADMADLVKRTP